MPALGLAQTVLWAGLYYGFPALLPHWRAELGWSAPVLAGAFTLALLVQALAAPFVGRHIDAGHGRAVLLLGAAGGALGLVGLAALTTIWQFYLVWAWLGLAMAGCLYDACFSYVTRAFADEARRIITRITLFAGFAGTVSFPLAHHVAQAFGWRASVLVFAALILAIAVPALVGLPATDVASPRLAKAQHRAAERAAARSRAFWLLVLAFGAIALNHGMLVTHLLPLLASRGLDLGTAVMVAACLGPMQVVGRLALLAVEHRLAMDRVLVVTLLALAAAATSLLLATYWLPLAFAFVLLQGAGIGIVSIARPVLVADRLGRDAFGAVNGRLAACFIGCTAAAPTVAALLSSWYGYDVVLWAAFALVLIAAVTILPAPTTEARKIA
ncbi:MAG: MFS transporter [Geminicoccaceae bacterium]|nr:MAG: MFS transporter [Geminicoccaceae bacterium]